MWARCWSFPRLPKSLLTRTVGFVARPLSPSMPAVVGDGDGPAPALPRRADPGCGQDALRGELCKRAQSRHYKGPIC